jgi:molecular chaperone DnaJ
LQGKGVPHLRGLGKGDQYVRLKVAVPKSLTREQKELMKKLHQTMI